MIQRIQTLYLLLTTILPLLFLKLKMVKFIVDDGTGYHMGFNGLFSSGIDQVSIMIRPLWPVKIILILIPLVSFGAILLFRNRRLQMKLCLAVVLLTISLIASEIVYSLLIVREYRAEIIPGFAMMIPLLILIFIVMAWRGIKKDEDLVKSYDRLR